MRFAPLLFAVSLFASAGGSPTVIDPAGNVWQTGQTNVLQTTPTAFQKTATAQVCATQTISPFQPSTTIDCQHAYLTKQDPSGNILYATYLGGSSQDGGIALTTDAQGNVYLAGYTYSADFPVTPGVVQSKNAGPPGPATFVDLGAPFGPTNVVPGGDVFVAKFASDGTLLFSTFLGGSGEDFPTLIAVDPAGSIYVAGITLSTDFPVTANALTGQGTSNFFARLNATGTALTYSTYFLSSILAFDVDKQGRAYLTGNYAQAPNTPTGQPYVTILDTVAGAVVASSLLPDLKANLAGAGVAIALNAAQNLELAVSPAPPPYNFLRELPPERVPGDSFLFELATGAGAILAETDVSPSQFDSILADTSGNVYAFGHGTGAMPTSPIQLLASPCTPTGGSFAIESNAAGNVVAASYFRQGNDTAVSLTAPGHVLLYRTTSSTTVPMDLSAQPTALFGCAANLATGLLGTGLAPGEIFMLTGTGIGPAQGIGAAPNAAGQYPTSLGGVQVLFGATPAPLLYVSANEIHGVAPFGFFFAAVQVQYDSANPPPLDLGAVDVNPGIFSINGQGAIINQDGTVNTPANPAPLGSIVSVYCTGTGHLENPVTDGSLAPIPPPYNTTEFASPLLTFAGVAGTTLWSGAAPGLIEGVTQINVQLPASLPAGTTMSAVPVILSAPPNIFSPPVNISVKQ
jgi:uncharacterized protein (TIGR03437 family)